MNNNQKPSKGSTYTNPTASPQKSAPAGAKKKRRKIRIKPNKEGILSLVALILIVVLAVATLVLIIKGITLLVDSIEAQNTESTTDNGSNPPPQALPWNNAYVSIEHANTNIPVGNLILVNFEKEYTLTDSLNSKLSALADQDGYCTYYVLNTRDVKIRSTIIGNLKEMIFALVDANPDTLGGKQLGTDQVIITSGYRDMAKQEELFNKNAPGYSAEPGHSEHHTGYAVDIQIFTAAGKTVLLRPEEQAWMEAHCAEYGFVIRYDGSKSEKTGILDEPWHYRYVGLPHATYMTEHSLCLEEYLELIRTSHKYEDTPLEITAGEKEYLVYYVEASEELTFTSIPVPPASEGTYTISGDNMNGFIVTVEKAS